MRHGRQTPTLGGATDLELRLERVKRLGYLRLEYLQRFFDRRPIFERYLRGEMEIHTHLQPTAVNVDRKGSSRQPELCVYLRVVDAVDRDLRHVKCGAERREAPMLVRVGQVAESCRPVRSLVGLQLLDRCQMGVAE